MIKRRNVFMVPVLLIVTFGLYGLIWLYATADELIRYNKQKDNPFLWVILALIPPLNVIAIWFHSQAVAKMSASATGKGINGVLLFVLWFVPIPFLVAMMLSQLELNKRVGEATKLV
jgi:hypothetical protein